MWLVLETMHKQGAKTGHRIQSSTNEGGNAKHLGRDNKDQVRVGGAGAKTD